MLFHNILTQLNKTEQQGCDYPVHPHKVLLHGIDTLVLTAGGTVAPSTWVIEQFQTWESIQKDIQDTGHSQTVSLADGYWELLAFGSQPYKFQLQNPEIGFIKVWNPQKWIGGANNKQQLHIQLRSKFIHSFTYPELRRQIDKLVSCFFETLEGVSIQVSRLDLHADISHYRMLDIQEVQSSISKAKRRQEHFANNEILSEEELLEITNIASNPPSYNKGVQKLITPELASKILLLFQNQNTNNLSSIIHKKDLETAYFGKIGSDIWGKIYDKTKEVKTKNDSDTPDLWRQQGWSEEMKVVRVEFSMKRDFLKQLDEGIYVDIDNAFSGLNEIWLYLTNNWLRLVEKVKENNTTTSVITDFWKVVIEAFDKAERVVIRAKNYSGKVNQLYQQGLGCISQMISIGMNNDTDTLFLNVSINKIRKDLIEAFENGEFLNRRKLLGVAV